MSRKLTCDSAFRRFLTDFGAESSDRVTGMCRLTSLVRALGLTERQWDILNARLGMGARLTLSETGKRIGGLSRERVRQIQRAASRKATKCLRRHVPLLLSLEALLRIVRRQHGYDGLAELTINDVTATMRSSGWEISEPHELTSLVMAVRASVDLGKESFERFLPDLTFYACSFAPPVPSHTLAVDRYHARHKADAEHTRPKTYGQLAHEVLQQAGQPLHFREIARRVERLRFPRPTCVRSVHNKLNAVKDTFVLVAPGTFGLATWRLERVETYHESIAQVLKQHGRTLARDEILLHVSAHRPVKPVTLRMLLDTHPRFYRSVEGLYGLRAWLPERKRQTLRSANHFVEDSTSWARIARARGRGYDIERLVAADKPQ